VLVRRGERFWQQVVPILRIEEPCRKSMTRWRLPMKGKSLVEYVGNLADRDSGAMAALSRSLSFEPGTYPPAFPALEPLVGQLSEADRSRAYLIAGLWARYGRRGSGAALSLVQALRKLSAHSESVKARFSTLLDADLDELPHRLRQAVALVSGSGIALDWASLHDDLARWSRPDKLVQQRWARRFFAAESKFEAADSAAD